MPKLSTTATVTTEVKLKPALKKKLMEKLKEYQRLKPQMKALEAQLKKLAVECGDLRDELDTGSSSLKIDGFSVVLVAPTYKKFDPKKFTNLGGDLRIYEAARDEKPKKSFNRIYLPGEPTHENEERDDE